MEKQKKSEFNDQIYLKSCKENLLQIQNLRHNSPNYRKSDPILQEKNENTLV